MEHTFHYTLLAVHTLFQKCFLLRLTREHPELLPGQPKVIDYLMSHPSSFQREIAEGCLIEPATLSPILEKMEKNGLIRREKADGNRKNTVVSLTEQGKTAGSRIRELFRELEESVLTDVPPQERDSFVQILSQIQQKIRRMVV